MSEAEYRVTRKSVVHRADCHHVSGVCSTAIPVQPRFFLYDDRACSACLPDGLPHPSPAHHPTRTTTEENA